MSDFPERARAGLALLELATSVLEQAENEVGGGTIDTSNAVKLIRVEAQILLRRYDQAKGKKP